MEGTNDMDTMLILGDGGLGRAVEAEPLATATQPMPDTGTDRAT